MKFKHRLEYALLRTVIFFVNLLPVPVIMGLSATLGWLGWVIYPFRLPVAYSNMSTIFPELAHGAKLRLLRKAYLQFTQTFGLIFILHRKRLFNMVQNAEISGREHLEEALARGKGAVVTTYHGCWFEAYFAWFNSNSLPTSLIYQKQSNPLSDKYFIRQRLRHGSSLENLHSNAGLKRYQQALNDNRLLIVSLDQSYIHKGCKIPFFNKTLGCAKGTALLHLRTGAPVLTSFYYLKDGKLHIDFTKVVLPEYSEITEANIADISRRSIAIYEPSIRQYPAQWFSLFHRLWNKNGYPKKVPRTFQQIFF